MRKATPILVLLVPRHFFVILHTKPADFSCFSRWFSRGQAANGSFCVIACLNIRYFLYFRSNAPMLGLG